MKKLKIDGNSGIRNYWGNSVISVNLDDTDLLASKNP